MEAKELRLLALEPFYGGSHRAFLDGWAAGSRLRFEILSLPAFKWKWRMRHSALNFAEQIAARWAAGVRWHALLCSDMLDLAQLRGLEPGILGNLPTVVYFHENQLTYPVQEVQERDLHFAFTNFVSALVATETWFNSSYHREEWLGALDPWLRRMPDHQPRDVVAQIRQRSRVMPPGIDPAPERKGGREPGPIHILWVARWEHDKDPETLFRALGKLKEQRVPFRLSVLGERFRQVPEVFSTARETFAEEIVSWGYLPSREQYRRALTVADVVVSTARHEFFGLAVVEAIASGCFPILPERLAYPEILSPIPVPDRKHFFFDGSAAGLAAGLAERASALETGDLWQGNPGLCREAVERFEWPGLRARMDQQIEDLVRDHQRPESGAPVRPDRLPA